MTKVAEKIVLETEFFTLFENGFMVAKEEALNGLANENSEVPFWRRLELELEDLTNGDFYIENTGNAPTPFRIGCTSVPVFFIGMFSDFDDEGNDMYSFEEIYAYVEYETGFWQDMLFKNGEVWFQKL